MTKSHVHAENMKLYAEDAAKTDKPWELWETGYKGRCWVAMTDHPQWKEGYCYRRKAVLKTIDWEKVINNNLPVKVWDEGRDNERFVKLSMIVEEGSYPFHNFVDNWDSASLDTGEWVFNSEGVNPWPEGCIVQVWCRGATSPIEEALPAISWDWDINGSPYNIIASRFVRLQEGWTFDIV